MSEFELLILLMSVAVVLVSIAQKVNVAYPIALVIGGGLLSFMPGLNFSDFDPNILLIVVLPPILYHAAFWTSIRDFMKNFREIFSLSFGLVIATTLVVGLLFKWFFPQFPWALAFAFGAIVSPPDATAACAILKRFSLGQKLTSILEGESLVNDAAALVLYRIAVTALLSGTFSLMDASIDFALSTVGGTLIGVIFGYLVQLYSRRYLDPVVGAFSSFLIPYIAFILAQLANVSGVLAVVASGIVGARMVFRHHSSLRRVLGHAAWDQYILFLNCLIFILIGSQLDEQTRAMSWSQVLHYTAYAFLITVMMFVIRLIWICLRSAVTYMTVTLDKTRSLDLSQLLREGAIVGWAGMRGIVSLTAALAMPLTLPDGSSLPGRSEVIYMTYCVILFTLLLPGLSLAKLMKLLNITSKASTGIPVELRQRLAQVAQEEIVKLHSKRTLTKDEYALLQGYMHHRSRFIEEVSKHKGKDHPLESARKKVLHAERQLLLKLWEQEQIDDKVFATIEHELDLEETSHIRAEI